MKQENDHFPQSDKNIQVVVRIRPPLAHESKHTFSILDVDQNNKQIRFNTKHDKDTTSVNRRVFNFDEVFESSSTQSCLFNQTKIAPMIASVLNGYHATIFAYGQTGSGKTFTMEGYEYESTPLSLGSQRTNLKANTSIGNDRLGIVPRVIKHLFQLKTDLEYSSKAQREYSVKCSFIQIYNEKVFDLLNPVHLRNSSGSKKSEINETGLRLRWTVGQDFYVDNMYISSCSTANELLNCFHNGIDHKIMASHRMNAASSRSHCVFTVYVESFDPIKPNEIIQSKLTLVDLAGSERVSKTGATGTTLKESIGINKSLFVLRQVIQVLSDHCAGGKIAHIPYRDSKLTSILKHSLGGNSITLMIACISPSDSYFEENLSTLLYASRAQSISNKPVKNEDPKSKLIRELKLEISSLKGQLLNAQQIVLGLKNDSFEDNAGTNTQSKETDSRSLIPVTNEHVCDVDRGMDHLQCNQSANLGKTLKTDNDKNENENTVSKCGSEDRKQKELKILKQIVKKETKKPSQEQNLKINIIENVSMIKDMYKNERNLRLQLDSMKKVSEEFQRENRNLNIENQNLRQRIEVLEYLAVSSETPEIEDTSVPEYGLVANNEISTNKLPTPSTNRISAALQHAKINNLKRRKKNASIEGTNFTAINELESNHNQDESDTTTTMWTSGSSNTKTKRYPRKNSSISREIGSLSVDALKKLLNGPSVGYSSIDSRPFSEGTHRKRKNTLRKDSQQLSTGNDASLGCNSLDRTTKESVFSKDPLENLTELSKLLQDRANLKRQSQTAPSYLQK